MIYGQTNRTMTIASKEFRQRARLVANQLKPPFRGAIEEYARTIKLGSGYLGKWAEDNLCRNCRNKGGVEKCRHFEIDTARHLLGPFKAIYDPHVRVVMLLKAAQTAGSTVWDLTVHWALVHSEFMRIKVFLDCDDKAREYCQKKLMETLRANPDVAPLLPTGSARFGVTDTEMRLLNGKILTVCGLNETNASSLPSDLIIIDEGWLHQSDGLMKKAFDRAKQVGDGAKIVVVGQAGDVNEDQDIIWKSLHKRVPLTWACPSCGGRQTFELNKERTDNKESSIARAQNDLMSAAGMPTGNFKTRVLHEGYYGFRIAKRFSELHTPEEIKAACAETWIECQFCGYEIHDTKENRWLLNNSFEQDYQVTGPNGGKFTPDNYSVGFWNPDPASMFVPFARTMQDYVQAKKAKEDTGNDKLLIDFYRGNWATAWDPNLIKTIRARTQERYDAQSDWPEEWRGHRCLVVDCQQELQYFWASAWAVSKSGKSRQLWRGVLRGFGEPIQNAKLEIKKGEPLREGATIAEVQAHFGILDQFVFLDAGYMKEDLVEEAAKHGHWVREDDGEKNWYCWTLMVGSDSPLGFAHKTDGNAKIRHKVSDPFYESPPIRIDGYTVSVEIYYFSTLKLGDMFVRYRDGRGPEWQELPETEDVRNRLSWTAQINACSKVTSFSKKDGAPVEIWKPPTQTTAHHYWDICRMFMAVHCIWNLSGDTVFEEPPTVERTT